MAKAKKMNRGITGAVKNHPDTSPKLFKLSKGHSFEKFIPLVSFCGVELSGWAYGTQDEVTCGPCRELIESK